MCAASSTGRAVGVKVCKNRETGLRFSVFKCKSYLLRAFMIIVAHWEHRDGLKFRCSGLGKNGIVLS